MTQFGVTDLNSSLRHAAMELHQLQDQREIQWKQALIEKDKKIEEKDLMINKIKEDFSYNLFLIDARDKEIKRLNSLLAEQAQVISEKSERIDQLLSENKRLALLEESNRKKFKSNQESNKQLFLQLKSSIEKTVWEHEEIDISQKKMIETLRFQIKEAHEQHNTALETQRNQLSQLFDELLSKSINEKQRQITDEKQRNKILVNKLEAQKISIIELNQIIKDFDNEKILFQNEISSKNNEILSLESKVSLVSEELLNEKKKIEDKIKLLENKENSLQSITLEFQNRESKVS